MKKFDSKCYKKENHLSKEMRKKKITGRTDPLDADVDNDGMLDGEEIRRGIAPYAKDFNSDTDRDGLINSREIKVHRNLGKRDLIAFNLIVGVEWNITTRDEFDRIATGLKKASKVLFDATDGHFLFGRVEIWDNVKHEAVHVKYFDKDAPNINSPYWPHHHYPLNPNWAWPGGIEEDPQVLYHRFTYLPRYWHSSEDAYVEPLDGDNYGVLIAHEFGHNGLFLWDEYKKPYGGSISSENQMFTLMGYGYSRDLWCDHTTVLAKAWAFLSSPLDYTRENTQFWRFPCPQNPGAKVDSDTLHFAKEKKSAWETVYDKYNKWYGSIGKGHGIWVEFDFEGQGAGVPPDYVGMDGPDLDIIVSEVVEVVYHDG